MLEHIANWLVAFQWIVFAYFLVLNTSYTAITFYAFRYVGVGRAAAGELGQLRHRMAGANARPISVLVPAYNEALTIIDTVQSALDAQYPEHEVIVIDDGSTDDTLARLVAHFDARPVERPVLRQLDHEPVAASYLSARHPNLWILSKRNGGKADALNAGIEFSGYPLVCAIDADTLLEQDALLRLGQQFTYDKRLVALGGAVRVLNGCTVEGSRVVERHAPRGVIECTQAAEYIRGFLAGRVASQRFRSLLIISGAFGLFRKDLLLAIGGYRKTVGEDMDIVIRLHRHCIDQRIDYHVGFVPEPVCWTQVPSDLGSLLQQRNRWQRGLIDSLWHSRGMCLNPRYGIVGLLGFPYFLFFELLGPVVEFLGYAGFIVMMLLGWIDPAIALLFFVVAVLWGMWLNVAAALIDSMVLHRYRRLKDTLRIALWGSLEFVGFRQLLTVERLIGTFHVRHSGWGRVRRRPHGHDVPPGKGDPPGQASP
jgi:cellulose synthase/poly-beta-1,6-N-acetylglucosamine synthase-like glycosyltransferase